MLSCTTSPQIVEPGVPVQIHCTGHSPRNRPLTYSCATEPKLPIDPHGSTLVVTTNSFSRGSFLVRCTVADDQGLSAAAQAVFIVANVTATIDRGKPHFPIAPLPPTQQHAVAAIPGTPTHDVQPIVPPSAASQPTASVPGPPMPAPAPSRSDSDDDFLKWHKGLPLGQIQDNIDTYPAMRLGVPYTVTVTIAGEKAAPLSASSASTPSALQVSPSMRVLLTNGSGQADGFTIADADDPKENPKPLAPDGTTQWNWTVTPNRLGNLQLHIAAFVLKDDSDPIGYSYESYNRTVDVKSVTLWGYLTNGLVYLLENPGATIKYWLPGGGGAAILAALFTWWKKRKAGAKSA
jgi:hypothetical protein